MMLDGCWSYHLGPGAKHLAWETEGFYGSLACYVSFDKAPQLLLRDGTSWREGLYGVTRP
jgi:hypothetical protein